MKEDALREKNPMGPNDKVGNDRITHVDLHNYCYNRRTLYLWKSFHAYSLNVMPGNFDINTLSSDIFTR